MDKQNLYFVFENCQNGSLVDLIDSHGKFSFLLAWFKSVFVKVDCNLNYVNFMLLNFCSRSKESTQKE